MKDSQMSQQYFWACKGDTSEKNNNTNQEKSKKVSPLQPLAVMEDPC